MGTALTQFGLSNFQLHLGLPGGYFESDLKSTSTLIRVVTLITDGGDGIGISCEDSADPISEVFGKPNLTRERFYANEERPNRRSAHI